jgi:hypothetical protein
VVAVSKELSALLKDYRASILDEPPSVLDAVILREARLESSRRRTRRLMLRTAFAAAAAIAMLATSTVWLSPSTVRDGDPTQNFGSIEAISRIYLTEGPLDLYIGPEAAEEFP